MDFSNYLFRCSSLGHLMTDPQDKKAKDKGELSITAKKHLVHIYISTVHGRQDDIETSAIKKGTTVEEDSITVYSAYKREMYVKNEDHLKNDYIKGTPDIRVKRDRHIVDIKSSWDIYTFYNNLLDPPKGIYLWQVQGYMWLDNAVTADIAHCLVDTPEFLINIECDRLRYKVPPETLQESQELLRNKLIYQDIPYRERVIEHRVERNQSDIDKIKYKVVQGRKYLNRLYENRKKNLLLTELK